jgi:murein DD-endopeptidase MepM/ murein hydrolase activator NlpD
MLVHVPAAAADPAESWTRPVEGAVVRPFDPPATRYGAGHLGVDLAAAPGTPVRAAGAGVVAFAGAVGGTRHVVVRHANGWRTTYAFLATVRVAVGERVAAGAPVGTAGGRGDRHDGATLHLGLRIGERDVDPARLFAPLDLAAVVSLAPVGDEPGGAEPVRREPVGREPVGGEPAGAPERAGLLAGLPAVENPVVCRTWDGYGCP